VVKIHVVSNYNALSSTVRSNQSGFLRWRSRGFTLACYGAQWRIDYSSHEVMANIEMNPVRVLDLLVVVCEIISE
jgi:hypothetical protein